FRHFSTPDKKAVILDLRSGDPITRTRTTPSPVMLKKLKGLSLDLPDPRPIARKIRASLPAEPPLNTDASILSKALDFMIQGNYQETVNNLKKLWTLYPNSKYLDPGLFLLGEAYYQLYQKNLDLHFVEITDVLREAITTYPESKLTPRGTVILGLVYLKMNYNNEAAGYFKIVIKDYPDTRYAVLASLHLGEAYLDLGEPDLAQDSLDTVMAFRPTGQSYLEVYYRLGQVHFQKGMYTKANEIFKEILNRKEDFYLEYPEILYYMGEGYFHSKRLDLARTYLYHLLNIYPDYQARDMAMARIGDAYKEEGRHQEAKKIYRITRNLYPDSTGAMISQLRLAEYGALRDTFDPETIFIELEEGARETTIRMYQKVVAEHKDSPLIQLALFKIGLAAYWQKDYKKALQNFKDVLEKFPNASIIPDVRIVMSKTILAQIRNLYRQDKYLDLLSYYFENQRYISELALPDIRHYVAMSHLALGLPEEAIELFLADQGVPDSADERLLGLGIAYFKTDQYEKAVKALNRFLKQYPNHKKEAEALLTLAHCKMKQGKKQEALTLFEKVAAVQPKLKRDGEFQNTLGRLYLERGQYTKAAAALDTAAKNLTEGRGDAQDVFLTYTHLGRALAKAKRGKEAARALDMALKVRPKDPFPEALYLIARANFSLGRSKEGLEALKLVSETNDAFWKMMADQEIEARKWDKEIKEELKKESTASLQER
ncbi:MAG: tetratricopeptide repeat protein, partial [Deltaproteobacteria bacterium]|nr:tetratricopeptide repeat protein [Deltaproteobacteria bacterium]